MIRRILPTALLTAGMLAAWFVPADAAGPPGYAEGVRAYGARQYKQALSYFAMASAKAPTDPMIHYYMGLSYQGMNQMTLARQEYTYVAGCRNPALAGQASQALSNLSRYSGSYAGSGYAGSAVATSRPGAPSAVASASTPPPSGGQGPTAALNGRLKILYFTTDW